MDSNGVPRGMAKMPPCAGTQTVWRQYELCDKNPNGLNVYNGSLVFRHFAVVIYKYGILARSVSAICRQLLGLVCRSDRFNDDGQVMPATIRLRMGKLCLSALR
jgi:hypothetical protein